MFTVECSKYVCRKIAEYFQNIGEDVETIGSHSCLHNQVNIRRMLKYCTHPNVGGVLVIGHGCEYTYPSSWQRKQNGQEERRHGFTSKKQVGRKKVL